MGSPSIIMPGVRAAGVVLKGLTAVPGGDRLLYADSSKNLLTATVGTGLSFSGGTLSCTVSGGLGGTFGATANAIGVRGADASTLAAGGGTLTSGGKMILAGPVFLGTGETASDRGFRNLNSQIEAVLGDLSDFADFKARRFVNGVGDLWYASANGWQSVNSGGTAFRRVGCSQADLYSASGTTLLASITGASSGKAEINSGTPGTLRDLTLRALFVGSQADSAAANSSLYYSTDASKLVWKDAGGVVNNLY